MLRTGASSSVKTFHGKAFTATKGHRPDSFAIVVGGKLKIEKKSSERSKSIFLGSTIGHVWTAHMDNGFTPNGHRDTQIEVVDT